MAAPAITTSNQYPDRRYTATIPVKDMSNIADALALKLAIPHAFRVDAIRWRQGEKPVVTAAKLSTATLRIAGTAATGGVVALTSAACTPAGAKIDGTTPTAGNTGAAGDTVEVVFSSTTAFAAGDAANGWFEFTIVDTSLGAQAP